MTKTLQYGYVENGKLHILNRARLQEDLRQFKNCDVQIIIKKKGKRSLPQNAYYWGVVIEEIRLYLLEKGSRFDADTVHEFLKQKFNYESIVVEQTGERIDIGQTTTEMNKDEFSVYVDRVIEWSSTSLGLVIPPASKQTEFEYQKG